MIAATPDLTGRVGPLRDARTEHAAALEAEVARQTGSTATATPPRPVHILRCGHSGRAAPLGRSYTRPDAVKVVHSVGSDTVIGKKVVTLELDRAARDRGLRSVYVPTGQTGVAIAGWGIAVDHVISDYVAGAGERLVLEGAERGDLLFVEGQGGLFHPAYSGVTLGLLHGSAPDLLVLVHKAGATSLRNYPDLPIPPLAELVSAYEGVARPVRPTRVAAIALNTADLPLRRRGPRRRSPRRRPKPAWWPTTWCASEPHRVLDAVLEAL